MRKFNVNYLTPVSEAEKVEDQNRIAETTKVIELFEVWGRENQVAVREMDALERTKKIYELCQSNGVDPKYGEYAASELRMEYSGNPIAGNFLVAMVDQQKGDPDILLPVMPEMPDKTIPKNAPPPPSEDIPLPNFE